MTKYIVEISPQAKKQLKKIDTYASKKIVTWIDKNLVNCVDPYLQGKPLKGNLSNHWRYRIGDYRLISQIDNNKIKIIIVSVGHRKEIYD
ncbi:MAG: type II toxin-antitoxin system RelE/ParE family toxin [Novosphingobium sp.]|nr:type II toxin-antitoxin system RelE/ParE family toxin [Novosphingobium sp.]